MTILKKIFTDVIFAGGGRVQTKNYSPEDLANEFYNYFNLPISTADKILSIMMMAGLAILVVFIAYRTIRHIWRGNKPKKQL